MIKPRFKPKVKKQGSEGGEGLEEGMIPRPIEREESVGSLEDDKPKKWQRKGQGRRKSQLQESFPSYMQVGFYCIKPSVHLKFYPCPYWKHLQTTNLMLLKTPNLSFID